MAKVKSEYNKGTLYGREMRLMLTIEVTPREYDKGKSERIDAGMIIRAFKSIGHRCITHQDEPGNVFMALMENLKEDDNGKG